MERLVSNLSDESPRNIRGTYKHPRLRFGRKFTDVTKAYMAKLKTKRRLEFEEDNPNVLHRSTGEIGLHPVDLLQHVDRPIDSHRSHRSLKLYCGSSVMVGTRDGRSNILKNLGEVSFIKSKRPLDIQTMTEHNVPSSAEFISSAKQHVQPLLLAREALTNQNKNNAADQDDEHVMKRMPNLDLSQELHGTAVLRNIDKDVARIVGQIMFAPEHQLSEDLSKDDPMTENPTENEALPDMSVSPRSCPGQAHPVGDQSQKCTCLSNANAELAWDNEIKRLQGEDSWEDFYTSKDVDSGEVAASRPCVVCGKLEPILQTCPTSDLKTELDADEASRFVDMLFGRSTTKRRASSSSYYCLQNINHSCHDDSSPFLGWLGLVSMAITKEPNYFMTSSTCAFYKHACTDTSFNPPSEDKEKTAIDTVKSSKSQVHVPYLNHIFDYGHKYCKKEHGIILPDASLAFCKPNQCDVEILSDQLCVPDDVIIISSPSEYADFSRKHSVQVGLDGDNKRSSTSHSLAVRLSSTRVPKRSISSRISTTRIPTRTSSSYYRADGVPFSASEILIFARREPGDESTECNTNQSNKNYGACDPSKNHVSRDLTQKCEIPKYFDLATPDFQQPRKWHQLSKPKILQYRKNDSATLLLETSSNVSKCKPNSIPEPRFDTNNNKPKNSPEGCGSVQQSPFSFFKPRTPNVELEPTANNNSKYTKPYYHHSYIKDFGRDVLRHTRYPRNSLTMHPSLSKKLKTEALLTSSDNEPRRSGKFDGPYDMPRRQKSKEAWLLLKAAHSLQQQKRDRLLKAPHTAGSRQLWKMFRNVVHPSSDRRDGLPASSADLPPKGIRSRLAWQLIKAAQKMTQNAYDDQPKTSRSRRAWQLFKAAHSALSVGGRSSESEAEELIKNLLYDANVNVNRPGVSAKTSKVESRRSILRAQDASKSHNSAKNLDSEEALSAYPSKAKHRSRSSRSRSVSQSRQADVRGRSKSSTRSKSRSYSKTSTRSASKPTSGTLGSSSSTRYKSSKSKTSIPATTASTISNTSKNSDGSAVNVSSVSLYDKGHKKHKHGDKSGHVSSSKSNTRLPRVQLLTSTEKPVKTSFLRQVYRQHGRPCVTDRFTVRSFNNPPGCLARLKNTILGWLGLGGTMCQMAGDNCRGGAYHPPNSYGTCKSQVMRMRCARMENIICWGLLLVGTLLLIRFIYFINAPPSYRRWNMDTMFINMYCFFFGY